MMRTGSRSHHRSSLMLRKADRVHPELGRYMVDEIRGEILRASFQRSPVVGGQGAYSFSH